MNRTNLYSEIMNLKPQGTEPEFTSIPEFKIVTVSGSAAGKTEGNFMPMAKLLRSTVVALQAVLKEEKNMEYGIPPLEAQYWVRKNEPFETHDRESWLWTAFYAVPDMVSGEDYREAVEKVRIKEPESPLHLMKFERIREGEAVQYLHLGKFSAENSGLHSLVDILNAEGYIINGKYHEIYLTEKFGKLQSASQTIVRLPVKKRKKQSRI